MRQFILIAPLILVSATAHAGENRGLIIASNDEGATAQTTQTTPTEAAKPATPRAAVKPRETEEQKARRIAARYGISW